MSTEFKRFIVERPKEYLRKDFNFDQKTAKLPTRKDFRKIAKTFRNQIENKPEEG